MTRLLVVSILLFVSGEPPLPLLLERMEAAQRKLTTLSARLQQSKSYPQLGIEDPTERGLVYFSRGRLRIEIQEPESRILVVKDEGYILYQPRIRQAISGKLPAAGSPGPFSLLLAFSPGTLENLSRSYALSDRGEETVGTRKLRRLELLALPGAQVHCIAIELFVDTRLDLPVRQKCREPNRNEITVELSGLELDRPLPPGVFELALPDGVERIERK